MFNNVLSHGRLLATMLVCGSMLAACDAGKSNSGETSADRQNVDAMSDVHARDTTDASPAAEIAPGRAIISQEMPYTEYGDELVYGYFAAPADMFEPLPAVIMIHEWWGLNNNVRAMADRLAGEGYIVFAVDLYAGEAADTPEQARALMLNVVEDPEPAKDNLRAAFDFLKETAGAPRIGTLGWCFGGGWSLNSAQLFGDDLDASVIYYGQVTSDDEKLQPITAPILGLFAAEDAGIKVESVEAFEASLERLRKNYDVHVYPGVGHAFANPTGNNYNADAAEDAWAKTLAFLKLHLAINET